MSTSSRGGLAIVRGKVIGDPGKPVAGWVSLGKREPQRWIAHAVRIHADAGHEIVIEGLGAETIVPVSRAESKWRDLEGTELAQLCSREAPAPDVDVDFTTAVVRGGDAIAAWGEVTDHGYVSGAGEQGEAFRGTTERGITKLNARVVAIGDDRDALLDRARERMLAQQREDEAARAKRKAEPPTPAPKAAGRPKADPDYVNRIAWNLPLWITLGGLGIIGAFAATTGAFGEGLRSAAVIAFAPIALDAVLLPRFRIGALAPPSLEIPFIGLLLAATGVVMTSYAIAVGDISPSSAAAVRVASYVLAGIALLALAWLWSATRTRRRWVAMMVDAPPHEHPVRDGVWGAVDGAFSSEVMSIGETAQAYGAAVKDAAGIKSRSVHSEGFANLSIESPLRTAETAHHVRLADAAILTMAKLDKSTGTDRGIRADVINARTPVRVVGRTRDGTFVKGGEASLLVFAGGIDTEVVTELRRLHWRHRIAIGLAAAGLAALAASFVV